MTALVGLMLGGGLLLVLSPGLWPRGERRGIRPPQLANVRERLVQAGLRVPEDISVLGYDDDAFAPYASPPLSTIRIPTDRVATNACRHLLNLCYGLDLPVTRDFPPEVVWRASVGPGPHAPMECP